MLLGASIALLLAALVGASLGATESEGTCARQYHLALQEASKIKQDCGNAAFYDCCQVPPNIPLS